VSPRPQHRRVKPRLLRGWTVLSLVVLAGAVAVGAEVAANAASSPGQASGAAAGTTTTGAPPATTTTGAPAAAATDGSSDSTTTTGAADTTTTVLSSGTALVQKQPPAGGYQVQVPTVWHYANKTIPSDHITNVWTDPATPGQKLIVVASGCIGCVETSIKDRSPNASKVMPAGAQVGSQPDPYTVDYQAPSTSSGMVDYGQVLILHRGSVVTGYVRLDAELPSGDQQLADRMFNGFSLSASSSST
jgi:hypothetical protein